MEGRQSSYPMAGRIQSGGAGDVNDCGWVRKLCGRRNFIAELTSIWANEAPSHFIHSSVSLVIADVTNSLSRRVINVSDLRRMAQRRLPPVVFDYLDGGADGEITLR